MRPRPISFRHGSDSNFASGAPVTLHQAAGVDPPRFDPKHLVVETWVHRLPARMKYLCLTPDFKCPVPGPWSLSDVRKKEPARGPKR